MAACAHDLLRARKPPDLTTAIKQLINAQTVERRVRSIQYQMRTAKFPHHKDFATFDYSAAAVTQAQIEPFCTGPVHTKSPQSHRGRRNWNGQNPYRHRARNDPDQQRQKGPVLQCRRSDQCPDQGAGRGQCRQNHPATLCPRLRHHRRVGLHTVPQIRWRAAVPSHQQAL